ncbi:MAG: leukotoxin LktA family filamentous adhesin, partial [Phascolarctobacterium sp.]
MTYVQKGARYTIKNLFGKAREENDLRMKVLRYVMAVGFVLSPWLGGEAYAGENTPGVHTIVRKDNTEGFLGDNNVAHIYAAEAKGNVGLNKFSSFSVPAGKIANLYFQKKDDPTILNTLVNLVEAQIDIQGTVNAIRDGKIGGNLYFISPKGMVVGSGGVINAGSLTAIASNLDEVNSIESAASMVGNANFQWAYTNASIQIQGQINTATGIDLRAAKIVMSGNDTSSPLLKTGVVFSTVVNAGLVESVDVMEGRLTASKDTDGNIIIADPSNTADVIHGDGAIKLSAQTVDDNIGPNGLGYIELQAGAIDALGNVSMTANGKIEDLNTTKHTIDNSASITAGQNVSITSTNGGFKNNNEVEISATGDVTIQTAMGDNNAGKVTNQGKIEAGNNVTINAYSLDNDVPGTEEPGDITKSGIIIAGDNVSVTTDKGTIINDNKIQATKGYVHLNGAASITNGDVTYPYADGITAGTDVELVSGNTMNNNGKIVAGTNNEIEAGQGKVEIISGTDIGNIGSITANNGSVTLIGSSINNGTVTTTSGSETNKNASISAGKDVTITANDIVTNDGTIKAGNGKKVSMEVTSNNGKINNLGTVTATNGNIELKSKYLINLLQGTSMTAGTVTLDADSWSTIIGGTINAGTLQSTSGELYIGNLVSEVLKYLKNNLSVNFDDSTNVNINATTVQAGHAMNISGGSKSFTYYDNATGTNKTIDTNITTQINATNINAGGQLKITGGTVTSKTSGGDLSMKGTNISISGDSTKIGSITNVQTDKLTLEAANQVTIESTTINANEIMAKANFLTVINGAITASKLEANNKIELLGGTVDATDVKAGGNLDING